ncbi:MAG: hypothetical protein GY937_25805 [bacterium]|nr:hypothetical protein [bacterium]
MQAAASARWMRGGAAALLLILVSLPAAALEFFDRRLQIHGFYEQQIRSIWTDFSGSNDWDLTQWYHVLNLEIEAEIAPDGFGPFDMVSGFARIEARFDCVWRRGCWMFDNVDVYGDRSGRLPQRIQSGRATGFTGTQFTGEVRREFDGNIGGHAFRLRNDVLPGSRVAVGADGTTTYGRFFGASPGLDGVLDDTFFDPDSDDPIQLLFRNLEECQFASRRTRGTVNGVGSQGLVHNIKCEIEPLHDAKQFPNPFRAHDFNGPVLGGAGGGGALPLRPAPEVRFDAGAPPNVPSGIWYPNERLQQALRDGDFDSFDQNFTVNELQWNRGASQQDEKELKEAYLEFEMFDSRLWLRAGKQAIVWGKTELFSTTDQLNPRDLALASLPSLEESRIAQWALRAVYSFYDVGPLEDVRFEVAAIFDQFEPNDIGRCGEPYTPLVACGKTFGLLNHGQNGVGLAGEIRPPNPWNSWKGIDVGARLEWRWGRFSFALTDFYGYDDLPYADVLFSYSRNVDPRTGRPRKGQSTGSCRHGSEDACLTEDNALLHHSANQSIFAWVCAGTVGVSDLDPSSCAQTIFNSQVVPALGSDVSPVPISTIFSMIGAADNTPATLNGNTFYYGLGGLTPTTSAQLVANAPFMAQCSTCPPGTAFYDFNGFVYLPSPLVPLDRGDFDGVAATEAMFPPTTPLTPGRATLALLSGISPFLTDEQEALLGCGSFYGTNCDVHGIDFLNTEASVFFQSWPGVQGTYQDGGAIWDTTDRGKAQPGTVNFEGEVVGGRRGEACQIPGSRGPGDPCYDSRVDGAPLVVVNLAGDKEWAVHPFTGQKWRSEMSIVSWNFLMAFVGISQGEDGAVFTRQDANSIDVFDPNDSFSKDRCSYARPIWCNAVKGLIGGLTGLTRSSIKAGGNGRFGRRNFLWTASTDLVLRYEKRNVLGFSMDFAEDVTKTNWGIEFTWQEGLPSADADAFDGNSEIDTFNLTFSVDRPTFINFMNANRTFFFNSQWFFQYIEDYTQSHTRTGPWNAFFTFTATTGYFQDRLLPSMTFVYDVKSNSGAFLPQLTYRFTENFSATFGLALFAGRWKEFDASINGPADAATNRVGKDANKQFGEPGLSAIRERDEVFLRLRYTF